MMRYTLSATCRDSFSSALTSASRWRGGFSTSTVPTSARSGIRFYAGDSKKAGNSASARVDKVNYGNRRSPKKSERAREDFRKSHKEAHAEVNKNYKAGGPNGTPNRYFLRPDFLEEIQAKAAFESCGNPNLDKMLGVITSNRAYNHLAKKLQIEDDRDVLVNHVYSEILSSKYSQEEQENAIKTLVNPLLQSPAPCFPTLCILAAPFDNNRLLQSFSKADLDRCRDAVFRAIISDPIRASSNECAFILVKKLMENKLYARKMGEAYVRGLLKLKNNTNELKKYLESSRGLSTINEILKSNDDTVSFDDKNVIYEVLRDNLQLSLMRSNIPSLMNLILTSDSVGKACIAEVSQYTTKYFTDFKHISNLREVFAGLPEPLVEHFADNMWKGEDLLSSELKLNLFNIFLQSPFATAKEKLLTPLKGNTLKMMESCPVSSKYVILSIQNELKKNSNSVLFSSLALELKDLVCSNDKKIRDIVFEVGNDNMGATAIVQSAMYGDTMEDRLAMTDTMIELFARHPFPNPILMSVLEQLQTKEERLHFLEKVFSIRPVSKLATVTAKLYLTLEEELGKEAMVKYLFNPEIFKAACTQMTEFAQGDLTRQLLIDYFQLVQDTRFANLQLPIKGEDNYMVNVKDFFFHELMSNTVMTSIVRNDGGRSFLKRALSICAEDPTLEPEGFSDSVLASLDVSLLETEPHVHGVMFNILNNPHNKASEEGLTNIIKTMLTVTFVSPEGSKTPGYSFLGLDFTQVLLKTNLAELLQHVMAGKLLTTLFGNKLGFMLLRTMVTQHAGRHAQDANGEARYILTLVQFAEYVFEEVRNNSNSVPNAVGNGACNLLSQMLNDQPQELADALLDYFTREKLSTENEYIHKIAQIVYSKATTEKQIQFKSQFSVEAES